MPKHVSLISPEIKEILNSPNKTVELREAFSDLHHRDIFLLCRDLEPRDNTEIVMALGRPLGIEFFQEFPVKERKEIFRHFPKEWMARILEEMAPDERTDFIKTMPRERTEKILPLVAQAERNDIKKLISYEEGTAGSVLTTEYASLFPDITAKQAIEQIKLQAFDRETIYCIYVIDKDHKLLGFLSLKDLLVADSHKLVKDIMHARVISVNIGDDKEVVAHKISDYDLIAVPVVDDDNRLIGIVTHDDVIDIIRQEQTEDIEKFMAIAGRHEAGVYLDTPAWVHFKNRAVWVVSLAALGLVSGIIIHNFEETLMHMLILALYMPMIADTGGNTGSQSATVVVRALALKEISVKDALRVLFKEFKISLLMALILGLLSWGKVLFLSKGAEIPGGFSLGYIGFAIAVALSLQVVTATLIGASLPLLAARLKFDPAVVASPALTTVVDITGLLIYFTMAKLILGI